VSTLVLVRTDKTATIIAGRLILRRIGITGITFGWRWSDAVRKPPVTLVCAYAECQKEFQLRPSTARKRLRRGAVCCCTSHARLIQENRFNLGTHDWTLERKVAQERAERLRRSEKLREQQLEQLTHHGTGRRNPLVTLVCAYEECGKEFQLKASVVRARTSHGLSIEQLCCCCSHARWFAPARLVPLPRPETDDPAAWEKYLRSHYLGMGQGLAHNVFYGGTKYEIAVGEKSSKSWSFN
jgi:hypothetical protein